MQAAKVISGVNSERIAEQIVDLRRRRNLCVPQQRNPGQIAEQTMSSTRAHAMANAAPAPVIKSMALVPAATYAAPAAPQSKGSVRQNRLQIAM